MTANNRSPRNAEAIQRGSTEHALSKLKDEWSGRRARWNEALLCAVNRPLTLAVLELGRHLGDVARLPGIGRLVNEAGVARAILLDRERFNSHERGSFGFMITRVLGPRALINMDGPEHQSLKRHLLEVFTPRYIDEVMQHATVALVAELTGQLQRGETVDLADFMKQYAGAMACAMVGVRVPAAEQRAAYADIFWLATEIMSLAGLQRRQLAPQQLASAQRYVERLAAYMRASYEDAGNSDCSVTQRLRARGLSFDEVKGLVTVVLVGATELITYGLPRVVAVLVDSGQMPRLAAQPQHLDAAIDECFRIVTPSNVILRAVGVDCEVAGHRFQRGERVLIAFRNIMRNPKHFPSPQQLDWQRESPPGLRRLPFGAGLHACLGTSLALAETRQILQVLLALGGHFELSGRRYNRGKIYPGYQRLLLRLSQRPS